MMQGIRYRYSALYKSFAKAPERTKFRRYLDLWSWMLYNETWEIEQKIQECNRIIASAANIPPDRSVFTITDYHKAYVLEQDPVLKGKIEDLQALMRRYGKDLLLAHGVANLPDQSEVWAKDFSESPELFHDGRFGPTKEDHEVYSKIPSHADTCSLRASEVDQQDLLTKFVILHLKSIYLGLNKWVAYVPWLGSHKDEVEQERFIGLERIVLIANVLTGICVPVIYAVCLGVLSCIESEKWRIVVLGAFGLLFTTLLNLCVPTIKRGDMFAITGALFAVGGIFIGTRSINQ